MAAIHFYTALAFSNCGDGEKAREQLREFFRFRPGPATIDPTLYPPRFVSAFGTGAAHAVDDINSSVIAISVRIDPFWSAAAMPPL